MRYPAQDPNRYRDLFIEILSVVIFVLLWNVLMTAPVL